VAHQAKAPARPTIIIELPDVPDPAPAGPPSTLDDLFPPQPPGKTQKPCFDRLQGVGGLSPCPDSTPRGGP
jgi:hypothetical protein